MIRGQARSLKTPKIKAKLNASIHNRFDIEVVDAKTGKVKQRAQAENVICNGYWAKIGNKVLSIAVGSGSGTPSATDTVLFNPLKAYDNLDWVTDVSDLSSGVFSVKIGPATIAETELVGSTITEVGYGSLQAIYTHATLKDQNGNQISIVKTNTDIINVYCTIFTHFNVSSFNGFTFGEGAGPAYIAGILALAYNVESSATYKYTGINSDTVTVSAVFENISADKQLMFKVARLGAASGNFPGGINKIYIDILYKPGLFATHLPASWYPGSNIVGEAIGTGDGAIKDFATDFVQASSVVIYVDGVEQISGVTVDSASDVLSDNVHFTTAPATGAAITADYHTDIIAKDENHVFDFSMEIQLGEYTT